MKSFPVLAFMLTYPAVASAQSASEPAMASANNSDAASALEAQPGERVDARSQVPLVAYTYSAAGTQAMTFGAQAYGLGLTSSHGRTLGGGGAVWGSPLERLTLIVDGQRNISEDFSPSAAAIVRLYGNGREGFTLGALGKYKIDGFGKGASGDEVESELEVGALMSFSVTGWHLDANAIGGRGLGDDGETDVEGRLRLGRDVASWLRVGIDGQARARITGPFKLPNGRTWDFAAGPQILACSGQFFGSLTAGPTTMGAVDDGIGLTALVSVGATTF